jgi:adenosine/AMP kinase
MVTASDPSVRSPSGAREPQEGAVDLSVVPVELPADANVILGQSHFVKTVEDLYEALVGSVPGLRFGLAFCEASGPRLVRWAGTDDGLIADAQRTATAIGAGHTFVVFLRDGFPINVLNAVKMVPEVCRIFAATANPLQVVVAETEQGRGIMGVIDGRAPLGIEGEQDIADRKELLRRFGYKL